MCPLIDLENPPIFEAGQETCIETGECCLYNAQCASNCCDKFEATCVEM